MLCRDCVSLLTSCPPVDREVCRILEQRKPSTLRGKGASCGSAREGDAGTGSGAEAAAHSTSGSSEAVIPRFFFKVCPRAPRVACSPHTRFQPATDPLSTTFEMAARRHALRNKINELPSEDVRSRMSCSARGFTLVVFGRSLQICKLSFNFVRRRVLESHTRTSVKFETACRRRWLRSSSQACL